MNNLVKNIGIWAVILMVVLIVVKQFDARQPGKDAVSYSEFMDSAKSGKVESATVEGRKINWTSTDKKKFTTYSPGDIWMVGDLLKYGVKVDSKQEEEQSFLSQIFISWFPMLLLIGVWIFFMRQMQGGGRGGAFSFGKSKARMLDEANNTITFADVAGCEEAKEEVAELVEFLRDPQQVPEAGRPHPARRAAGRPARAPARRCSPRRSPARPRCRSSPSRGSDFVEMFVGVGAARVRDMFEQAKKNAPCIIFIDEIDAVGRQRGAGLGGGNDEREQTLNQLLVEMDGFEGNAGVIVIAATNRPDVLDPALLRPGRFDRQVVVPLPDIRGREQILQRAHAQGADGAGREGRHHRARHARHVRRGPGQSGQRSGAVRSAVEQAPGRHARFRARQGQDHHGRRAALDRDAGRGTPQHGLPRVRPRDRRGAVAQDRPGAQGDDHSARPRARRHDAAARPKTATAWTATTC